MSETDIRQQLEAKLEYFKTHMTEAQLRLLTAFASGILKKG